MNIVQEPISAQSYHEMYETEEGHWWFKSLRRVLGYYVKRINPTNVLDAGCGTGFNIFFVKGLGYKVYGLDISKEAIDYCINKRNLNDVQVASITDLPFNDDTFDLIYSMDVLTNLATKDRAKAVREMYRCTKKNGYIIMNNAALESLYSAHDIQWRIKIRYNKKQLTDELEESGFVIEKLTYRYFIVFPFIALVRLFRKRKVDMKTDLEGDFNTTGGVINKLLDKLMIIEDFLVRYINFPVGSSLFVVAKKL